MYSGPRDLSENKPHPSSLKPAPPSNAQMEETKQSELTAVSEVVSSQAHTKGNELVKENQELRDLCCFLDDERKKSRRLAHEWQSFGRYIASVLRNEVLGFENKMTVLQENLQKLSQENAELRDLCLFLNQMSSITSTKKGGEGGKSAATPKLNTPQVEVYATHAACVGHLNKVLEDTPQYTGFTGEEKLEDKSPKEGEKAVTAKRDGKKEKGEGSSYVEDLEKRLERLESEKLELVKSLSAAHILAATNETENKNLPSGAALPEEIEIKEPPNIKDLLEHIKEQDDVPKDDKATASSNEGRDSNAKEQQQQCKNYTLEDVIKLSILLDISKRLDAISGSNLQPEEATEIAALRMLMTVAFKELQSAVDSTGRGSPSKYKALASSRKSISSSNPAIKDPPPPPSMTTSYPQGTIIRTEL